MTARQPSLEEALALSTRARRGDLPAEQSAELERVLESSATLRIAHEVGRDFDAARRVRSGDDALIAGATTAVLARPQTTVPRRRRMLVLLAASFGVVASATAATAFFVAQLSRPLAVGAASPAPGPAPGAAAARPFSQPSRGGAAESVPAAPADTALPPAALGSSLASPTLAPASPAPPSAAHPDRRGATLPEAPPAGTLAPSVVVRNAASVFRDANAARREGKLDEARALYGELQADFPASTEARVSRVSLGKLLASTGQLREAERQFRQYLVTGGGDLAAEALVGRAEALGRLGESGEERRVWQELERSHPASVYAARARKRLEELGARVEQR